MYYGCYSLDEFSENAVKICASYPFYKTDIGFTGAIINNLTLEEIAFSNLKVSEKFPIKFSQSGKLTEVIDCWGFREVNILVRLRIIQT